MRVAQSVDFEEDPELFLLFFDPEATSMNPSTTSGATLSSMRERPLVSGLPPPLFRLPIPRPLRCDFSSTQSNLRSRARIGGVVGIECVARVRIEAPRSRCYAIAADVEGYPAWAGEVEKVTVVERGPDGQARRVALEVYLFQKDFSTTLDFDYGQAPDQVSFTLVESRKLRSMTGSYTFVPAEDGTLMTFRLNAEFVKPKAARIERFASRKVETAITRDLRRYIERQTRRVAR